MPKQIVVDTFETLGQMGKQTGKQIVQIPFKIAEAVPGQVGVKTAQETGIEQPQGGQTQNPVQQALNKKATERKLTYLQDELRTLRQRKAQGEQQAEQAQVQQKQDIKQLELEKKKEEPLAVVQARQKGGTREKKLMGVSG